MMPSPAVLEWWEKQLGNLSLKELFYEVLNTEVRTRPTMEGDMRNKDLLKRRVRKFFERDRELTDEIINNGIEEPIVNLMDALEATEKLFAVQKARKTMQYYFVEADLVEARERNRRMMGKVLFALLKKWAEEP